MKNHWAKHSSNGQNMVEYLLLFAVVVILLVVVMAPSGMFSSKVEETINQAFVGTKCVALGECFDPAGCPSSCGNGCCEAGEDIGSCPADCK